MSNRGRIVATILTAIGYQAIQHVGITHALQTGRVSRPVGMTTLAPPRHPPAFASSKTVLGSVRTNDTVEGATSSSEVEAGNAGRRDLLRKAGASVSLVLSAAIPPPQPAFGRPPSSGAAAATAGREKEKEQRVTIPLEYTGEAYVAYYRVDGYLFRGVVDTGSPFLMVPGNCDERTKARWGCYRNDGRIGVPSGLDDTYEMFDGVEGDAEWRAARTVTFVNATGSLLAPPAGVGGGSEEKEEGRRSSSRRIVFGVESESLLRGPGGVFFGLLRDTDRRIRPSFLGQLGVRSFQIDLASVPRTLTLSTGPVVSGKGGGKDNGFGVSDDDAVRLVSDLKRFGDPNRHYTGVASSLVVNGAPLAADGRPIYVIFDTGVTGMVVTRDLFDERYETARARREKSLWGDVNVSFRTRRGTVMLTAKKPITTIAEKTWDNFDGHLVVMGLSFLEGSKMTIDIDRKKLWIVQAT